MEDVEAQRQIQHMVGFILNEARDKAQEIEAKAMEDFNIEKLKLVQQMKDRVRNEYQKKTKQADTQRSISRSTAINKARLQKIHARNKVVDEVAAAAQFQLASFSGANKYETVLVDLIVQGLLRLLEPEVIIRCREEDEALCTKILPDAAKKYTDVVKKEAGVKKSVQMTIDTEFLPPGPKSKGHAGRSCAGGVILLSSDKKVTLDNTLDARLQSVVNDCLPEIRKSLFPLN